MMKKQAAWTISTIAAIVLVSGAASAGRPFECIRGDGARGHDEGYALERDVLDEIWSSGDFTCLSLERFVDAINLPIPASISWDDYLSCRNAGVASAIQAVIRERHRQCGRDCTDAGIGMGRHAGAQFCGAYAPPQIVSKSAEQSYEGPPICSIFTQQGCRTAMISYVNGNCPEVRDAQLEKFDRLLEKACRAP